MGVTELQPMVVVEPVFMEALTSARQTLCPTLTDGELMIFALIAQRKGLDPFSGQIIAVKRNSSKGPRVTYQTGIDGYRSLAEKTDQYLGSDEPDFGPACECGNPRTWHPEWARVTVHRWHEKSGRVVDQSARAKWHEFVPPDDFMWNSKPETMLSKCAEAQALRRAFPWVYGELYIPEELARPEEAAGAPPAPQAARSVVAARAAALRGDAGPPPAPPAAPPEDPPAGAPVPVAPSPSEGGPGVSVARERAGETMTVAVLLPLDALEFQRRADAAGLTREQVRDRAHELFPDKRSAELSVDDWAALLADLVP